MQYLRSEYTDSSGGLVIFYEFWNNNNYYFHSVYMSGLFFIWVIMFNF